MTGMWVEIVDAARAQLGLTGLGATGVAVLVAMSLPGRRSRAKDLKDAGTEQDRVGKEYRKDM